MLFLFGSSGTISNEAKVETRELVSNVDSIAVQYSILVLLIQLYSGMLAKVTFSYHMYEMRNNPIIYLYQFVICTALYHLGKKNRSLKNIGVSKNN